MIGRLAGTLALSRKKLTPLLAAVLFAGGTRRVAPIFCHRAIVSFPLDTFIYDASSLTVAITNVSFNDSILISSYKEVAALAITLPQVVMTDAVISKAFSDAGSLSYTLLTVSMVDSVKTGQTVADGASLLYGFVGNVTMSDSVKVALTPIEPMQLNYSIVLLEFGAP